MAEFPEDLIPDDPREVELAHYKFIAEWLYQHEASPADRDTMHHMIEEYRELYKDVIDLDDYTALDTAWHGWEYACQSFGWFLQQDCEGDTAHIMDHFNRAMRYSAIILLGMSDDLPSLADPEDDE